MAEKRLKLDGKTRQRFARIRRLAQMKKLDPIAFEHFVGYLYERQGYRAYTTVTSGDEGVDLILRKGRRKIIVQCKRYRGTVGQPVVRDLYGAMLHNNAQEAILATSGNISRPAETWAADKPIGLVDGHELLSMTRQVRMGGSGGAFGLLGRVVAGVVVVLLILTAGFFWANGRDDDPAMPPASPTPVAASGTEVPPSPTLVIMDQDATAIPVESPTPLPVPIAEETAVRLTVPPRLDGLLDEWDKDAFQNIQYSSTGSDLANLSAIWQAGWDDSYLYLALLVRDDQISGRSDGVGRQTQESIDIELDMVRTADWGPTVSTDDFWYLLLIDPGQEAAWRRRQGGGNGSWGNLELSRSETAVVFNESGYTVEVAIAWAELDVTQPPTDEPIGFALTLNDVSVGEVSLSTAADHQNGRPDTWGALRLMEN